MDLHFYYKKKKTKTHEQLYIFKIIGNCSFVPRKKNGNIYETTFLSCVFPIIGVFLAQNIQKHRDFMVITYYSSHLFLLHQISFHHPLYHKTQIEIEIIQKKTYIYIIYVIYNVLFK